MSGAVQRAYDRSAAAWRAGPSAVYARLAEALLAVAPVPVAGTRVLDVGAGTAVAGRAALELGASMAVGVDLSSAMLRALPPPIAPTQADAERLPFRDHSFDLVIAAFCLGHLQHPQVAMGEMRRVGGGIIASVFAPGRDGHATAVVDEVFARIGFRAPGWYRYQKAELEPAVQDPAALHALARDVGFSRVVVERFDVDAGLESAASAVAWRLGMAHLAPFVADVDPEVLMRARAEAEAAVEPFLPVVIPMLALSAS